MPDVINTWTDEVINENGVPPFDAEAEVAALKELVPPDVTSADNGKVLTVVDGEWDAAAPAGGGGDVYILEYAVSGDPDEHGIFPLTSETTFDDLLEIYESKLILLKGDMFGGLQPASLTPLKDGDTITGFLMSALVVTSEASVDFCAVQFNDMNDTKTLTIVSVTV